MSKNFDDTILQRTIEKREARHVENRKNQIKNLR